MTIVEQRTHTRYALLRQPVGEFRLHTPTADYPIKVINDISSSGMRIYLDRGRFIIGIQLLSPMLLMAMSGTY